MERPMHRDHALGLLGLRDQPNADADTIRKAYLSRAKEWHPDRNRPEDDPQKAAFAQLMMRKVNEAYEFLKQPKGTGTSAAQNGLSFAGIGQFEMPLSGQQMHYLQRICDLLGLVRSNASYSIVLQIAPQICGRLMRESRNSMFGVCLGNKRKGYAKLDLRERMLKSIILTPSTQLRLKVPNEVGRHMTAALGELAGADPLPPQVVVNAIAHTLEPLFLMLHAELEQGLELAIHRIFHYQKFEVPLSVTIWMQLNPGKTEADALRALGLRRGFFGRIFG